MTREQVLHRAAACILSDRNRQYGPPEDSFTHISSLWSSYLSHPITPQDVAILLGLMKVGRMKHNKSHEDSFVDAVGYFAIAGELIPRDSQSTEAPEQPPSSSVPQYVD